MITINAVMHLSRRPELEVEKMGYGIANGLTADFGHCLPVANKSSEFYLHVFLPRGNENQKTISVISRSQFREHVFL